MSGIDDHKKRLMDILIQSHIDAETGSTKSQEMLEQYKREISSQHIEKSIIVERKKEYITLPERDALLFESDSPSMFQVVVPDAVHRYIVRLLIPELENLTEQGWMLDDDELYPLEPDIKTIVRWIPFTKVKFRCKGVLVHLRRVAYATASQNRTPSDAPNATQAQKAHRRPLSRRKVIVSLAGMVGLVGVGGLTWPLIYSTIRNALLGTTVYVTYNSGDSMYFTALAWSPDGKRIVSGEEFGLIHIWNASNGNQYLTYSGHTLWINSIAWSPNGKYIASASGDKTVQVWDASTGHTLFVNRGYSSGVVIAVWSPNGKYIASANDKTVQVWNAITGIHVLTYQGHSDNVFDVAWSPDGKHIASASQDKTVQVWNSSSGEHIFTYRGHQSPVDTIAWSPNSKRIVSGSGGVYTSGNTNDTTVQVWDAATGGNIFVYRGHSAATVKNGASDAGVAVVAWSPNSQHIASGSDDHTVQVWNANNGGNVFVYRGNRGVVKAMAWSPDSTRIASACQDGNDTTVQVWQVP